MLRSDFATDSSVKVSPANQLLPHSVLLPTTSFENAKLSFLLDFTILLHDQ